MTTKIYVAGPRDQAKQVAAYMDGLRRAGYLVTHDWTAGVLSPGVPDAERTPSIQNAIAQEDMAGIRDAAVVWLLAPSAGGTGCWVELGYALGISSPAAGGWHRTVVVSGAADRTIFCAAPGVHKVFATHEGAYQWLFAGGAP